MIIGLERKTTEAINI